MSGEPYYTKERLEELLDSTCGGIAEAALDYLAENQRLREFTEYVVVHSKQWALQERAREALAGEDE